jgi:PhnB protein
MSADPSAATSLAPQLAVRDGRAAVAFYEAALGARVVFRHGGTDEEPSIVAQLAVGGSTFWVADESPEHGTHSRASLGGGTVRLLLPVADAYGWRVGRIADPDGHHWEIGRPDGPWPPRS